MKYFSIIYFINMNITKYLSLLIYINNIYLIIFIFYLIFLKYISKNIFKYK